MSINLSLDRLARGALKPSATAQTEPAADWEALGALTFTSLALSDIGCANDAEELVAAIREAYGDSVILKIAGVAAIISSGKQGVLDIERHMLTLFDAEELQQPMVMLVRSTLLYVEKDNVCRVDKSKFVDAKANLERLANSDNEALSRRARQVLGIA